MHLIPNACSFAFSRIWHRVSNSGRGGGIKRRGGGEGKAMNINQSSDQVIATNWPNGMHCWSDHIDTTHRLFSHEIIIIKVVGFPNAPLLSLWIGTLSTAPLQLTFIESLQSLVVFDATMIGSSYLKTCRGISLSLHKQHMYSHCIQAQFRINCTQKWSFLCLPPLRLAQLPAENITRNTQILLYILLYYYNM